MCNCVNLQVKPTAVWISFQLLSVACEGTQHPADANLSASYLDALPSRVSITSRISHVPSPLVPPLWDSFPFPFPLVNFYSVFRFQLRYYFLC